MAHTPAPFRLLRTGLLAGSILTLAGGAHVLGGGTLPAPAILVTLLTLLVLGSTILSSLRWRLPALLAVLAGSQLGLHHLLTALSAPLPVLAASGMPPSHARHTEEQAAAALQAVALHAPTMEHPLAVGGLMLGAHAAATVAAAVLLTRGEQALWALARWLRPLHRLPVTVPLPVSPSPHGTAPRPLPRPPWRNARPDTRRGPPLGAVALA